MFISVASVLSLVIWGNLTMIFLYVVCRIPSLFNKLNYKFLLWMFGITFLRFLLPVEGIYSFSANPIMQLFFDIKLFIRCRSVFIFGSYIYVYQILLFVWILGSLLLLSRMILDYIRYQKMIQTLLHSSDTSSVEPPEGCLRSGSVQIFESTYISAPMITGVLHPVIFLPKQKISKTEISMILEHELWHYRHMDILLKFFMNALCILYWWNPLIFPVKNYLMVLLEVRVDSEVYASLDDIQQIEYLECLKTLADASLNEQTSYGMGFLRFKKDPPLMQRIKYLVTKRPHKPPVISALIFALLMTCSCLIVLEPLQDTSNLEKFEDVFDLTEDCYIIQTRDGTYECYMNNVFIGTVNDPYDLGEGEPVLTIYKYSKEGEVIREYEKKKEFPYVYVFIPVFFLVLFLLCIRRKFWSCS